MTRIVRICNNKSTAGVGKPVDVVGKSVPLRCALFFEKNLRPQRTQQRWAKLRPIHQLFWIRSWIDRGERRELAWVTGLKDRSPWTFPKRRFDIRCLAEEELAQSRQKPMLSLLTSRTLVSMRQQELIRKATTDIPAIATARNPSFIRTEQSIEARKEPDS